VKNPFGHCVSGVLFILAIILVPVSARCESGGDNGFLFVPFPIYTPETKVALTLTAMHYSRKTPESRPSTRMAFLAYSQLNQFRAAGSAQSYLADGLYHVSGSLGGAKWPDKFFGIGTDNTTDDEEDFTSETVDARLAVQYRIRTHLMAGVSTEFRHFDITGIETGGELDTGNIEGVQGGNVFGIGPVLTYDSRDDSFYPRNGYHARLSADVFMDRPGDYSFQRYRGDLRRYVMVGERDVIALQVYVNLTRGDVPFQYLSKIGDMGGFNLGRGYYSGLFRERDVGAVQLEYRTHIWRNIGGAVFGGAGAIGPDLPRVRDMSVKPSGGFGLRYRLGGDETINLRLDFAVGKDSTGIYFRILESF